jgi:hypothetical protein
MSDSSGPLSGFVLPAGGRLAVIGARVTVTRARSFVAVLLVGACSSGANVPGSSHPSASSGQPARSNQVVHSGSGSSERELVSEREVLRALYPRMDAERRIADPEHPEHAIGTVTIRDYGDSEHACLVTLVRSRKIDDDMDAGQVRDIEGSAEIIYDIAVVRATAGEVTVRARTRDTFSISAPDIGTIDEVRAAVELQAIWVISERDDAILTHASGLAASESIGGSELSGEYKYTESGGRDQYALYRLVGGKLDQILAVQVESATMFDQTAPSADEGQTVIVGEARLDILDTETNGYTDVEVHMVMTHTEGVGEPQKSEIVERYVWDGERYVRAGQ